MVPEAVPFEEEDVDDDDEFPAEVVRAEMLGLIMAGLTSPMAVRLIGLGAEEVERLARLTRGEKKVAPPPAPGVSTGAGMGTQSSVLRTGKKKPRKKADQRKRDEEGGGGEGKGTNLRRRFQFHW